MFPRLRPGKPLSDDAIAELVKAMGRRGGDFNHAVPAGYTYLAQFVDHDITFDPTSRLGGHAAARRLPNFRTPRFDLDSLYGTGPADQPFLYDWRRSQARPGVKLLVGRSAGGGARSYDLPRNQQGRALIGDMRNDENVIIAQLHLLFIRFHNRVVDRLHDADRRQATETLFATARQTVRRHYQWIVMHDLLPRIVGRRMAAEAPAERRYYRWRGEPFIPVEFSGAAYRFGHSMVRASYKLNAGPDVPLFVKAARPGELDHLGGFRPLPAALAIEWPRFFDLTEKGSPDPAPPQSSRLMDTNFAEGLYKLPANISHGRQPLPRLNLLRGIALGLPTGAAVARRMGLEPLSREQLRVERLPPRVADEVQQAPPLWYYVLCEAESQPGKRKQHLGPVGGRIVAEVLGGLLEADPSSYVHASPAWAPDLGPRKGRFTMPDLIRFTVRGSSSS